MKLSSPGFKLEATFVKLKDNDWLEKQRVAGRVVAETLSLLSNLVKDKTTKSLLELDSIAKQFIEDNGCKPTFLHYKGFPNSVCISVGKQLVHAIPTDYKLQEGDVVSFDLGATTNDGVIADAAVTCIYGEPKSEKHIKLLETTKQCLDNAIDAISVGKRLGVIGNAIYKTARNAGFSVITNYGGHGISINHPHDQPFVSNRTSSEEGIRIQEGLSIAIEPLLCIGSSNKTKTLSDSWTVVCDDICAHWEDSIYVHNDRVEILTRMEN